VTSLCFVCRCRNGVALELQITKDGEEAIDYLKGEGKFSDRRAHPMPDLVVLDLKLPRIDGLQVLRWLKGNGSCSELPTIILSNSEHERDIQGSVSFGGEHILYQALEPGKAARPV
jgi:two-component system response regulator